LERKAILGLAGSFGKDDSRATKVLKENSIREPYYRKKRDNLSSPLGFVSTTKDSERHLWGGVRTILPKEERLVISHL